MRDSDDKKGWKLNHVKEYFTDTGGTSIPGGTFPWLSLSLCCLCCCLIIMLIFGIFQWYTTYEMTKQRYSLVSEAMKTGNTQTAAALAAPEIGAGIGIGARSFGNAFKSSSPMINNNFNALSKSIGTGFSGLFKQ